MKAFESLKGMLCDPDGKVCIQGTDADRAEIQRHLTDAGKMVDMNNSLIADNNYLRETVRLLRDENAKRREELNAPTRRVA